MLTNTEYAKENNVPAELPVEFEPFAMFTIDMGKVQNCVGRNKDGKRILKPAFPHLAGKPLFRVAPVPVMSLKDMRDIQIKEAEQDRKARLALYVSRGYAFETPNGEETEDEV